MPRLRRVDCSGPGIVRRRRGRGFEYFDEQGAKITEPSVIQRIEELAVPPAWQEVWVCPYPMGHIQATGTDAAGRKQYRYHDVWRDRRDREKFESMEDFARSLPKLRRRVERDIRNAEMSRERALACAARLLDRGFFRIGSEDYAEENDTYGIATMQKRHVTVDGSLIEFDYEAKGGRRRRQWIDDPMAAETVRALKRRRGGGVELLAYKREGRWVDVKSADINAYVKTATAGDFSAKDFRTWNATLLTAVGLAWHGEDTGGSKTARKRAKTDVIKGVAHYLGNTPAVCRASYIDPRVFDRFDGGLTIGGVLPELSDDGSDWPELQGPVEEAVLALLEGDRSHDAIEKVA